jgi:hypothetical protein
MKKKTRALANVRTGSVMHALRTGSVMHALTQEAQHRENTNYQGTNS